MAMEFSGKVALVTGAGSGIGKVATVLLAQQGARVAALSHTADEVEQTAKEIGREGGEAIAVVADTAQEDQMQRAAQQLSLLLLRAQLPWPSALPHLPYD